MRFAPIYSVNKSQVFNSCVKNEEMSQLHLSFCYEIYNCFFFDFVLLFFDKLKLF